LDTPFRLVRAGCRGLYRFASQTGTLWSIFSIGMGPETAAPHRLAAYGISGRGGFYDAVY
jgi:hypothetical protein